MRDEVVRALESENCKMKLIFKEKEAKRQKRKLLKI
jgi:hypothetical protein